MSYLPPCPGVASKTRCSAGELCSLGGFALPQISRPRASSTISFGQPGDDFLPSYPPLPKTRPPVFAVVKKQTPLLPLQADGNAKAEVLLEERCPLIRGSGEAASFAEIPCARWAYLQSQEGYRSEAMSKLMNLTGRTSVKALALEVFSSAMEQQTSRTPVGHSHSVFNFCFLGNPGTGKTTTSRLFAEILRDAKVRASKAHIECTAPELLEEGLPKLQQLIGQAMDGVLFIDEAYALNPMSSSEGRVLVDELLNVLETRGEDLSVILAGCEEEMEQVFFAYDRRLRSFFREVHFEDFEESELSVIWETMARERGWSSPAKLSVLAARRISKGRQQSGFGNTWVVRKALDEAVRRAMNRRDSGPEKIFEASDIIGESPLKDEKLQKVLDEVESIVGCGSAKMTFRSLLSECEENYRRELAGEVPSVVSVHRLFLGNRGTGKSSFARLYARALKHLRLLPTDEVVFKTSLEFTGPTLEESKARVSACLKAVRGKLLVVEEAEVFDETIMGRKVLEFLASSLRDNTAAVLFGPAEEMKRMMQAQPADVTMKFVPSKAFVFEDFTEAELGANLSRLIAQRQLRVSAKFLAEAEKVLSQGRHHTNFSNSKAIEALLEEATRRALSRKGSQVVLLAEDLGLGEDPLAPLSNFLAEAEPLRDFLAKFSEETAAASKSGTPPPTLGHFVLRASPTSAPFAIVRAFAKCLFGMGLTSSSNVTGTAAAELAAQHVEQTMRNVEQRLREAHGGVLFLDDADELASEFHESAVVGCLLRALKDPANADVVVVLRGLPAGVDGLFRDNPELSGHFPHVFDMSSSEEVAGRFGDSSVLVSPPVLRVGGERVAKQLHWW
eukprot:RCo017993